MVEALACGVPVLISDKVNIWREILDEQAGMVVTDSVDGTEQGLRRWSALSVDERAAYRSRALVCFEAHFDIRVCAEAVVDAVRVASTRKAV